MLICYPSGETWSPLRRLTRSVWLAILNFIMISSLALWNILGITYVSWAGQFELVVHPGDFYSTPMLKYEGKSKESVEASIRISESASSYFIPAGENQKRCMSSWNKLWGYSRCLGRHHHEDSDRFVFRRAQACLSYEKTEVMEKAECASKGLIEVAAYAYDGGDAPF